MDLDFIPPPARLALQLGDLHLWRIALDVPQPFADVLDPQEKARAARFLRRADRNRFTIVHDALRRILGSYLDTDPAGLAFEYSSRGKPALAGYPFQFNLAHSRGLALLGVCLDQRIGVDLEDLERRIDITQIVPRFFAAEEAAAIAALQGKEQRQAFFTAWTRKEAYIKATGEGLAQALDSFIVSIPPDDPPRLLSVAGQPDEPARWSFTSFSPAPGYVAAVAVEGQRLRISAWEYPRPR